MTRGLRLFAAMASITIKSRYSNGYFLRKMADSRSTEGASPVTVATAGTGTASSAVLPMREHAVTSTRASLRSRFTLPLSVGVVTMSASPSRAIQTGVDTAAPVLRNVVRETKASSPRASNAEVSVMKHNLPISGEVKILSATHCKSSLDAILVSLGRKKRVPMGANTKLFWILAGYFALLAIVYAIWSVFFNDQPLASTASTTGGGIEWAGTVALALSAAASTLIAFYIGRTHKAQGGELPEDRIDAVVDDGDAEQGFYSPWSWWPVTLAGSLAILFLGLALGPWLAFYAVPLVLIALTGWVFEYYRGYFAK